MMRRWLGPLAAIALTMTSAGCAASAMNQARTADQLQEYDLAVARYSRILRDDPDNVEARQGLERARLRAAEEHFARGRRLVSQGRFEDALLELQLATELNPGAPDAATALQQVRVALRRQLNEQTGGPTQLQALLERTQSLTPDGFTLPDTVLDADIRTGPQSTARSVFLLIGQLGNLSVTFDPQFRDVSAPLQLQRGQTVKAALDSLSRASNTFYVVTGPTSILVAPDTPASRREYVEDVVRQFTVQNADLKETMDALRIVADARYVAPVTGTNTILVRDTPERMQVIGRFLAAFDKARPEIVVNVEVLEVDRTKLQEYGLQIASPGANGIDGAADVNREGGLTLQSLRNLGQADVLMTNIPALYYRLLKTDARTRTLANPHIRMTDGTNGTASFGQRVPVPTLRVAPITQGGIDIQPQTQFNYEDIGVNIGITPRTHPNDDVTLVLDIELSSLGAPGFDGLPTFGSRTVKTSIRLRDGETNILAGLIREDERTERQTIPGLGDIPILGQLFGRNRREAQQTDVVIMLTPHIIRVLDLSEQDLRPLRLPREGAGGVMIDSPPMIIPVPPREVPPIVPGSLPPGAPGGVPGGPTVPPPG
jgi:general secretion pathway protein D